MHLLSSFPHYGLSFLILITVLVFVHELGHFLVARWCGVGVEVFSIGFGPELFGYTDKAGTRWRFSALPLGGYVRMFGSPDLGLEGGAPGVAETEADRARSFMNKSPLARIAISAAGPLANFLFAFLVLGVLYTTAGKVYSAPVIGEVVAGSAADRAGLKPGDTILSIDGHSIDRFEDLAASVQLNLAKPLVLHISRQSTTSDVTVVPDITEQTDLFGNVQRVGRLGVRSVGGGKVVRLDPGAAVVAAAREVYETSVNILVGIRQIITGSRSSEEVGGILRIAKLSGDVANLGIVSLIGLAALFSVNLGLLNLFPIPILDGGQIVYYLVEFVRGRPLTPRAQEWGLRLGLAALVGLMLFATWNDLVYLKVIAYIKALFT